MQLQQEDLSIMFTLQIDREKWGAQKETLGYT
jgi:hypothetical protein